MWVKSHSMETYPVSRSLSHRSEGRSEQSGYAVEGWAFINHLSLLLAYLVYTKLRTANLLSKFSIADFISHLKYIHKIKIKNSWVLSEISGKTQELLDALGLSIA